MKLISIHCWTYCLDSAGMMSTLIAIITEASGVTRFKVKWTEQMLHRTRADRGRDGQYLLTDGLHVGSATAQHTGMANVLSS